MSFDELPEVGVAMIGSGLMAKSHTMGYRNVESVYGTTPLQPRFEVLADAKEDLAARARSRSATRRWTTDWREAVTDPRVDVVDIVTPNFLHKEIAMAAIAAGKHVYCEKPLALNAADAKEMYEAAEKAGVKTLVGFNYLRNPAIAEARRLISSGVLGEIWTFSGRFVLDACSDPNVPFTWRFERAPGRQRRARRPRRPHHLTRAGARRTDQLGGGSEPDVHPDAAGANRRLRLREWR